MPDWFTHAIAGWITGKIAKLNVSLVIVGSLIPDLVKIDLAFDALKVNTHGFFDPLHTPAGALLVAGSMAFLFPKVKESFLLLSVGITTHFILDSFLEHVSGGIKLLFPLSWDEWQIYAISPYNYWVTLFAVGAALLLYFILRGRQQDTLRQNR